MRMSLIRLGTAILAACVLSLAACRTAPPAPAASSEWDKYVAGYLDAYFAVHPDIAVGEGRHEFDGKLPDFSHAAIDKQDQCSTCHEPDNSVSAAKCLGCHDHQDLKKRIDANEGFHASAKAKKQPSVR